MDWYRNRKTATKLMLAFGLVLAIFAGVGAFATRELSIVNAESALISDDWLPGVELAGLLKADMDRFRRLQYREIVVHDRAALAVVERELDETAQRIDTHLKEYVPVLSSDRERALYQDLKDGWEAVLKQNPELIAVGRRNDTAAGSAMIDKTKPIVDGAMAAADSLMAVNQAGARQARQVAAATYSSSWKWIIGVTLAAILIGLALAFVIARMIATPLRLTAERVDRLRDVDVTNLGKAADALAQGDLTVKVVTGTELLVIDTGDEVGDIARAINAIIQSTQGTVASFEAAAEALRQAMTDVRDSAENTSSSAQQLQASSEEISSGAQEQATSLEETAASLEQMTATVKQNAENAQQANQLAAGAREVAEKGGRVVQDAVCAMGEINTASKRIADIITTIDEIAFQTNILALNAAVEAARAGQQGRGFAVVAGEVRKLAQRSASAAKEIKGLIQDSVQKVEAGTGLVTTSGETLQEIVTSVKRVTDIVSEIAAASREQSTGIDQVNRAVTQMDQVTQANASQTEELASTAESLAAQAEQLQALVSRFRVDANGAAAGAQAPAKRRTPVKRAAAAPANRVAAHTNGHGNGNGNAHAYARRAAADAEEAFPSLDEFQEY